MASLALATEKQILSAKEASRLVNIFETRIRTHSELVTYGQNEIERAAEWGCVEHLLVNDEVQSQKLANLVTQAGGTVMVLHRDTTPEEYSALQMVMGCAALLRFSMEHANVDTFEPNGMACGTGVDIKKSNIHEHISTASGDTLSDVTAGADGPVLSLPSFGECFVLEEAQREGHLEELIEDEFLAMEAIYPTDASKMGIPRERDIQFKRTGVNACTILVRITYGVEMCIRLTLPEKYPSRTAEVSIEAMVGIQNPAGMLCDCQRFLKKEAMNSSPALYSLTEWMIDRLELEQCQLTNQAGQRSKTVFSE